MSPTIPDDLLDVAGDDLDEGLWPSKESRERERDRKQLAILRTAARLFNERGFTKTSVDDIAAQLKVSKPTIYHYFDSKDQMLLACCRMGFTQMQNAHDRVRVMPVNGARKLEMLLVEYALIVCGEFGGCVARTDDHELAPDSQREVRALKRDYDRTIQSIMSEAAADGSISTPNVQIAAFAAAGAINWMTRWLSAKGPLTPEVVSQQIVAVLLDGLKPRA